MPKLSEILNSAGPDETIRVDVPLELIFLQKGEKLTFTKQDPQTMALINSMEREGLLQPIGLRWVSDERLELVWGRRRFWAAKQLRWPKIEAHIGMWKPDETLLIARTENHLRTIPTAAQKVRIADDFMREWERVYGKDPSRKVGGLVRARKALRDPITKKFLPAPKGSQPAHTDLLTTENGDENSGGEPATRPRRVAGSTPISEADTNVGDLPETMANSVAKDTGVVPATARKTAALIKAFTLEQFSALGTCDHVTKKGLQQLAKMKDSERRAIAVNLVCMNKSVDDAIKQAEGDSDEVNAAIEDRKEDALSDNDWVKIYCANMYERLENPEAFRRAAILYRKTLVERTACAVKIRKLVEQAHNDGQNRFTWQLRGFCWIRHPDKWTVCWKCAGLNKQNPECNGCKGGGFELDYEWPKPKK